ncbi:hypothetical protein GQ602_002663 [Ophiocordyceps camponoti-floridani]|uniref:Uncharacterized protein n=1 Tax=Ophiocordyceps camponoti-floridani TaxID=2030778 RepID=A0A8H4VFV2_9HYPO|nr:hypothetical protein GQ602_002663 [Ophiocordyceps camponoti-floridani]
MKFLAVCALLTAVAQAAPILTTVTSALAGAGEGKTLGALKARQAGHSETQPSKKVSKKGKLPGGLLRARQEMPDLLGSAGSSPVSGLLGGLQARQEDQNDDDFASKGSLGGLLSRQLRANDDTKEMEDQEQEPEEDEDESNDDGNLLMTRNLEKTVEDIAESIDENGETGEDE